MTPPHPLPPPPLAARYAQACAFVSDIHEHLPVLALLASVAEHVTEFGVRTAQSTIGLLYAQPPVMVSYDIVAHPEAAAVFALAGHTRHTFRLASTLEVQIAPTELLFIDSMHTGVHLEKELALHASRVAHRIVLHDTTTFGDIGEDGHAPGLWPVVVDFLRSHPDWVLQYRYTHNNGLTVLERFRHAPPVALPAYVPRPPPPPSPPPPLPNASTYEGMVALARAGHHVLYLPPGTPDLDRLRFLHDHGLWHRGGQERGYEKLVRLV